DRLVFFLDRPELLVEGRLGFRLDLFDFAGIDQLFGVEVLDRLECLDGCGGILDALEGLEFGFRRVKRLAAALALIAELRNLLQRGRRIEGDFLAIVMHVDRLAVFGDDMPLCIKLQFHSWTPKWSFRTRTPSLSRARLR